LSKSLKRDDLIKLDPEFGGRNVHLKRYKNREEFCESKISTPISEFDFVISENGYSELILDLKNE
jgi:hypothetical protein